MGLAVADDLTSDKRCSSCASEKPLHAFALKRSDPSGRQSMCRDCCRDYHYRHRDNISARHRRYWESRKRTDQYRQWWALKIWRDFKITPEDWARMYEAQRGLCPGCRDVLSLDEGAENYTVVDHCHATGSVRGLLCFHCNLALGHTRDNGATLQRLSEYVTRA